VLQEDKARVQVINQKKKIFDNIKEQISHKITENCKEEVNEFLKKIKKIKNNTICLGVAPLVQDFLCFTSLKIVCSSLNFDHFICYFMNKLRTETEWKAENMINFEFGELEDYNEHTTYL